MSACMPVGKRKGRKEDTITGVSMVGRYSYYGDPKVVTPLLKMIG